MHVMNKRLMIMELSQIRYFIEVARSQHMTKSAEKLHIAQPALSQSVKRLENELGVQLFTAKGRNIVLTPCGQYLKKKLEPVIKAIDEIPDELEAMKDTESTTIRILVLAASSLVTQAIIDYKHRNEHVKFHVVQNEDDVMADIEIRTNLLHWKDGLEKPNRFICTEKIFLAVPDTAKYKNMTSIDLSDARKEGFISLMGSKQLRSICDTFCRHAGFEPNIIFESDDLTAVKNMIGANLGVGFWPGFTWGKLESDGVRLLEITNPDCQRDISISYRTNGLNDDTVKDFYNFLTGYFVQSE